MEVTFSVGWLTTFRSSSYGVPANSFMLATCNVDTDRTALCAEPGMSTSDTTDRVLNVFGRLTSDPEPPAGNNPPSELNVPVTPPTPLL